MKFTLSDSWTWDYVTEGDIRYLALNLYSDEGAAFVFRTCFRYSDLREYPDRGHPFTVMDAVLLTAFQEGLYELNLQDRWCMSLSLNALACARFARLPNPSGGRMYLPYGGKEPIYLGQVVSLYAKFGGVGDFIVLDEYPDGDVYRLMLLNTRWDLGSFVISQGTMVRVSSSVICPFRSIEHEDTRVRYA